MESVDDEDEGDEYMNLKEAREVAEILRIMKNVWYKGVRPSTRTIYTAALIMDNRVTELEAEYLRENKALQAIEALDMMLGDGVDSATATKDELVKFAIEVYEVVHSAQRGICFDSHDDWRKKADIILAAAKKHGIAEYQNPFEPDPAEAIIREMEEKLKAKKCGQ